MANISGSTYPTVCRMELNVTSGSTVTMQAPFDHLWVTNGSTVSALTIALPTKPSDGDRVRISSTSAITTLTFSPTVLGAATGITVGDGVTVIWSQPSNSWFVE